MAADVLQMESGKHDKVRCNLGLCVLLNLVGRGRLCRLCRKPSLDDSHSSCVITSRGYEFKNVPYMDSSNPSSLCSRHVADEGWGC